ncbi:MAG: S8 family peptidase, partial [Woeseiaceae bacterium]
AESVSWVTETDSEIAFAQVDSQFGPPVADNVDDDAQERKTPRAPRDKMSGPVAALAAAGSGMADIVVRYDQHPALFDDERVAELGGSVTRTYEHLDMRAITIPAASLVELAVDDNVDWLSVDDEISSTSLASRMAANVPAAGSINAGYSGSNVGIAVLDTGVSKHSDLGDDILQYSFLNGAYPEPEVADGEIVAFNDSVRDDKFGHGTHVAGVLSGSGVDAEDEFKGSATGAKVLALQVLDKDGGGSMSDVMAALDWLLTYGTYFDIRVVNLSLGKGISESNTTDPLVTAVENLWDAGMVVVVAAGNEGFSGSMTVTSPGNSRKVITVGSLTDNGTGADFTDDYVSSFSSRGPTVGDYVLKPDLLAPGNRVVAAISGNSKLAKALASRIKKCKKLECGDDYLEMSGTSMATPIVSAAAALMLDKDPSLTPATVKARLMRSAMKLDADPSEAGAGLIDVEAALDDSGTVSNEALSPLMVFDEASGGVLVEDTAALWGDAVWGSGYLYNNGFSWAGGAAFTDENGVTANGYMWTDGNVSAKGYMWTNGGVSAKGYMWTDGVDAKSLLDGDDFGDDEDAELFLNDDAPSQ